MISTRNDEIQFRIGDVLAGNRDDRTRRQKDERGGAVSEVKRTVSYDGLCRRAEADIRIAEFI